MKNKLSTILSILVCAVFVAAAVCVGTYRGWSHEREEALAALSSEGGLHSLLETRALDAANLAIVAARHLPESNADLRSLRETASLLLSGQADLEQLMLADEAITEVAQRFASELPGLRTVQDSQRDRAYISVLTSALSRNTSLQQNCGQLVEDFNQRLNGSLMGRLAMLLGVEPVTVVNNLYTVEPRFPECSGVVTDAAGVLSRSTLSDLNTLDDRLDDADALRLRIATVDFLDAADAQDYAASLFARWRLDDEDILLVLAVGEDQYALHAGKDAEKRISARQQAKLLAANLETPFLQQEYDAAIAAYAPVLADEIAKTCDADVNRSGLFGAAKVNVFDNWAEKLESHAQSIETAAEAFLSRENRENGVSLMKVILTVVLLMIIFGNRRSKKGGIPFGKILAGFALFKLWKRR